MAETAELVFIIGLDDSHYCACSYLETLSASAPTLGYFCKQLQGDTIMALRDMPSHSFIDPSYLIEERTK